MRLIIYFSASPLFYCFICSALCTEHFPFVRADKVSPCRRPGAHSRRHHVSGGVLLLSAPQRLTCAYTHAHDAHIHTYITWTYMCARNIPNIPKHTKRHKRARTYLLSHIPSHVLAYSQTPLHQVADCRQIKWTFIGLTRYRRRAAPDAGAHRIHVHAQS